MEAKSPARFRDHVITSELRGGYQVVAADLNRDGKPDLVVLASGMKELFWLENPGWERHLIAGGFRSMINVAVTGGGADGAPEIVLATEFSTDPAKSLGLVHILKPGGDVRDPWTVKEIDRLPASHRVFWADFDGAGSKAAVNIPLAGSQASPPGYRDKVPLVCYRPGDWKRELISDQLEGVVHGCAVVDWDGNRRDGLVIASFNGLHLLRRARDGRWNTTELARGNPDPWPKSGSSDVAVGRLGKRRFLAAIEPWHGNIVAVYAEERGKWERRVIDDTLVQGHALAVADLNGDGRDEIIAGYRGKGGTIYVYSAADKEGRRWSRETLDAAGFPASSVAVTDLNSDGRPDLVAISNSSVKWYENLGAQK